VLRKRGLAGIDPGVEVAVDTADAKGESVKTRDLGEVMVAPDPLFLHLAHARFLKRGGWVRQKNGEEEEVKLPWIVLGEKSRLAN